MKSNNAELEKRIESILQDLDFSEITKEPLSKSFDDFLAYAKQSISNKSIEDGIKKEGLLNFFSEYMKSNLRYDKSRHFRIEEWEKIAEDKFSRLLNEDIGIPQYDISIIRKPFYRLLTCIELLNEHERVLKEFNFSFLMEYKGKRASVDRFFERLKRNKCVNLSALYDSSIGSFIKMMDMQVELSSTEAVNKKFLEEISIPLMKLQEGYINEEKLKEEFEGVTKLNENFCNLNLERDRKFLVENTNEINRVYCDIRKRHNNLAEYLEKDLGLGSRPLFPSFLDRIKKLF